MVIVFAVGFDVDEIVTTGTLEDFTTVCSATSPPPVTAVAS